MERFYMLSDRVVKHIPCNAMQCQADIAPSGYLAVFPHHFSACLLSLRFPFFCVFYWEGVRKNRIFYGQADRKRLPHPPSKGQLFMNFLVRFYFRV